MPRNRKPFISEIASEWRKVHRSNADAADLIRELEYPAIRERIRSPPIPLRLLSLQVVSALLFVFVRFPLHVLKRFGLANVDALVNIHRDCRGELREGLDDAFGAFSGLALWLWHWLGIVASCIWIELQIVGQRALIGVLIAVLYVALFMGLFWLLLFILGA